MQLGVDVLAGPFSLLGIGGSESGSGFTLITVTLVGLSPDLVNSQGTVTAIPTSWMRNGSATVLQAPIVGIYDGGSLTSPFGGPMQIVATDDVGTTPAGVEYVFTLDLDGSGLLTVESGVSSNLPNQTLDLGSLL
jgi:hypothetical protein